MPVIPAMMECIDDVVPLQKNDLLAKAVAAWEEGREVVQRHRFFEGSERPDELLSASVPGPARYPEVQSDPARFAAHFAFMIGAHPQVACDGEGLTAEEVFAIIARRLPGWGAPGACASIRRYQLLGHPRLMPICYFSPGFSRARLLLESAPGWLICAGLAWCYM